MSVARFLYDIFSTHQPVLFEAVQRTRGSVVEFGCGYGSTSMLHSLCEGRSLLSLESDQEWLDRFLHLETVTHKLNLITDWQKATDYVKEDFWDVAFIDHAPWEARVEAVEALKHKARFIVLHDCDYFVTNTLLNFGELFKHHKVFLPLKPWPYKTGPPTLLASNYEGCYWDIDYAQYQDKRIFN